MEPTVIPLHLSKVYLLTAKANAFEMRTFYKTVDKGRFEVLFGRNAEILLFSYMAVEAYVKMNLFRFKNSKNDATSLAKLLYSRFLEKFKFEGKELKRTGSKGEGLLYDIDSLCYINGYDNISYLNEPLWAKFKIFLRDYRHFIVHPKPKDFSEKAAEILRTDADEYPQIAGQILAHFYLQSRKPIPKWVCSNNVIVQNGRFVFLD
ncbi:MAG: hypothetical protein PHV33_05425 [Elusimicrobiales bacterium]|nr:hypothetical protein [Elusimicrobiales bacterium]